MSRTVRPAVHLLLVTALLVGVVSGAPLAAADDDDDDTVVATNGTNLELGGPKGINLGTDGLRLGGDSGIALEPGDGVSVGGESGIHAEVGEGVSVGGDDGITVGLTDGIRIGGGDGIRLSASSSGVGDLGYDLEAVDSTDIDSEPVDPSNASPVTATPVAGENDELNPGGRAPMNQSGTTGTRTWRPDTATPATEQAGTETATATTDRAAGAVPAGFDGELPVPPEGAAAGGAATAALLGAAGIAIRQTSMVGGTGTETAAARAASTALATGDGRLARMLSVFRYSRYDDSDPLELDARRHVYEAISDQPGEPITAVSDRAGVNLSTARHHVKVLQREGLVATARVRNCERFYPAGTDDLELAAAMADECTADILDALVRMEPASVSGLAEAVDRSPSTVTHHLQKLEDDGIVVRERNGRSVENKLSEAARAALDPETERRQHAAERKLEAERADAAAGASAD